MSESENYHQCRYVAVYGTLRSGSHNNRLLSGAELDGIHTVKGYSMYVMSPDNFDSIPFVTKSADPDSTITVEVWSAGMPLIDGGTRWADVMQSLDWLEDHPNWYTRIAVETTDGTVCWMYVFDERMTEGYLDSGKCQRVPSGDYFNPLSEEAQDVVNS